VICSEGAAAHLAIEAGGDARQRIELEVLLLPLLHTGDRIGRVIGAMSATSQPQWPDKGRLTNRRLLRHELIRPERLTANRLALEGHRRPPSPLELSAPRVVHGDGRQFRVLDGGRSDGKHSKS
jgi:hypothetical protein